MPKYPGISPYDNEKGTLGTAKKRWEKLYVKDIESDTINGMNAEIQNLATTAENSVAHAVAAKNAAETAKTAAQTAAETAATAAAGIQSVVETDVDATLSISGVAADAKVTGDWLNAIAKPVTGSTETPGPCDEFLQYVEDAEHRLLFGIKRDGSVTWPKGVPKHVIEACNPTMENDEYLYLIKDAEDKVLFGIKRDGSVTWPKGTPKHVIEACNPTMENNEYLYAIVDQEKHVLFAIKKDGTVDWQKGVPKPVKEKLEGITQTVIDSLEFVQLTQDADGKLIEGVTSDGGKVFFSPVRFGKGVQWSDDDARSIMAALINGHYLTDFDYNLYTAANNVGGIQTGLDVLYLNGSTEGMTKDNKVNLSYSFRGQTGTCTCKWQGASSIGFPKKNYTIAKLTPSIDVGWGSQKKYCLKADYVEYSHARNVVGAKLWGQIVKSRTPVNTTLSALPNGGAVDGFPIMLVINDEYQGLYNFTIPKDPWMLGMGEGNAEAMITAESDSATTRFKATVSRNDILAARFWEIEYVPDEDSPDWAINSFNQMLTAVLNSTGANYRSALQNVLDIESAIDYYIFCCLVGHHDGTARNFIMSTYNGTKWFFTAYDVDTIFGTITWSTDFVSAKTKLTFEEFNNISRIMHLIYTYDKGALKARYWELRNSVLSEDNIALMFSRYISKMPKAIMDEEAKRWPSTPGTSMDNYEQIVNWYRLRVKFMDEEINSL